MWWLELLIDIQVTCDVCVFEGFLRKVYGILSVQLLFTTLVGAFFMMCEPVKEFVQHR